MKKKKKHFSVSMSQYYLTLIKDQCCFCNFKINKNKNIKTYHKTKKFSGSRWKGKVEKVKTQLNWLGIPGHLSDQNPRRHSWTRTAELEVTLDNVYSLFPLHFLNEGN